MSKKVTSLRRLVKGYMLKTMPGMITCREFEEFIIDYLEESLPTKERTVFDRHALLCRECREYLAAYDVTTSLCETLKGTIEIEIPPEVPPHLITAILEARQDE